MFSAVARRVDDIYKAEKHGFVQHGIFVINGSIVLDGRTHLAANGCGEEWSRGGSHALCEIPMASLVLQHMVRPEAVPWTIAAARFRTTLYR